MLSEESVVKAAEKGKEIEIIECVAYGAFDVLRAGDRPNHDPVDVPIYKIGPSGLERLKELIGAK